MATLTSNISWDQLALNGRKGYSKIAAEKLIKLSEEHGFNHLVNEPTRIHGNTASLLDLVFTNNSSSVYKTSASVA